MVRRRGRSIAAAVAVALGVVCGHAVGRWALAQAPAGSVFHVVLSKDLRGQFNLAIKKYDCKDPASKTTRKMWTGTAKPFKLEVASNKDCDELPELFAG